jgi:hypothetical protein
MASMLNWKNNDDNNNNNANDNDNNNTYKFGVFPLLFAIS